MGEKKKLRKGSPGEEKCMNRTRLTLGTGTFTMKKRIRSREEEKKGL